AEPGMLAVREQIRKVIAGASSAPFADSHNPEDSRSLAGSRNPEDSHNRDTDHSRPASAGHSSFAGSRDTASRPEWDRAWAWAKRWAVVAGVFQWSASPWELAAVLLPVPLWGLEESARHCQRRPRPCKRCNTG